MTKKLSRSLTIPSALLFIAFSLLPIEARAFDLGFVCGINSANQGIAETTWGTDASAKATFVLGALLNFSVLPTFSIELGGFYATDKTGTTVGFDQTKNLIFPLLARVWVLPILSFGAGPYFSLGFGDFKRFDTPTNTKPIETSFAYEDRSYSKNDFGAAFSVDLSFPIAPGLNVLGDIRYYLGLNDRNTSGTGEAFKTRTTQILAGIQFTY